MQRCIGHIQKLADKQESRRNGINKLGFHSCQLPDGSKYFGQTLSYIPKSACEDEPSSIAGCKAEGANFVVTDAEQVDPVYSGKIVKARHGFGIAINSDGSKYIGDWHWDQRTGEGHMLYKDGSEYRGSLKNGVKHGFGHFKWPQNPDQGEHGHNYIGQWVNNKMQGQGEFLHRDQFVIDSHFVNNMFEHESGHWILPYLSTAEQQDFKDLVQQTQREAV